LCMLVLLLAWPRYFFPFLGASVFLLLEPLNALLKHPSLLDRTQHGDWRQVMSLSLGCLMCGFFWELWNYYSYPKWIYHVPFVDFLHVFEMPLLGYGGYLVFAWELFALYFLATGVLGPRISRKVIDGCEEHAATGGQQMAELASATSSVVSPHDCAVGPASRAGPGRGTSEIVRGSRWER